MAVWLFRQLGKKVAYEDLPRHRRLDHTSELNRDVADDVIMDGWIQAFRLVELVAAADVEAGPQPRHRF